MAGDFGVAVQESEDDTKDQSCQKKERWPLWKLSLLAAPQFGVQILWCFLGPNSAPYMLHLGLPASLATLNNVAGPITGFFTGPLVGAVSDNGTWSFGRRRPIILLGLLSTWVAGLIFAGSEHVIGEKAIFISAPMYWIMDITVNILQTPHRALVADLAAPDQQITMQVIFVIYMALGNFAGFGIMKIYKFPVEHMLTLMAGILGFNTLLVIMQFVVARETPLSRGEGEPVRGCCSPVVDVYRAVRGSPKLLYHLVAVQCLVWIGNTAWSAYGMQWFGACVFQGDETAAEGTPEKARYAEGNEAFTTAGQLKSAGQLITALIIIFLTLKTPLRPRTIYAPCIFVGAVVSILAFAAVGHNGVFAMVCMTLSILPEAGSFAIPFGLVAILNERAIAEGKTVSTAVQMALLNCCITVGQQICTVYLSIVESKLSLEHALPLAFLLGAVAQSLAGSLALCLNDKTGPRSEGSTESGSCSDPEMMQQDSSQDNATE